MAHAFYDKNFFYVLHTPDRQSYIMHKKRGGFLYRISFRGPAALSIDPKPVKYLFRSSGNISIIKGNLISPFLTQFLNGICTSL